MRKYTLLQARNKKKKILLQDIKHITSQENQTISSETRLS